MKKIICMLLLVQSGFIMAQQTKTVVTPNGEKVTFYPSAPGTADNGLTITDGNIQLGGTLTKASSLTTSATNTLAIKDLQTGVKADEIVTVDANGILRKITNNSWDINGNAGTIAGTNFIGTTDDVDLVFKMGGSVSGRIAGWNTSFGYGTMAYSPISIAVEGNVAFGDSALPYNEGSGNSAIGSGALAKNIKGISNTAVGRTALAKSENTSYNTVLGASALMSVISGESNTVIGANCGLVYGFGKRDNSQALTSITSSVLIGNDCRPLTDGSENEIVIGAGAVGKGSNTVTIGNDAMGSIGGYQPWSNYSDSRLKKNIVSSTYGLDFINKLRPVLYNMKTGTTELQTGFIAQEVEAAANSIGYKFSGVVKPQSDNDFYSLSYGSFVVPLVKAMQEQQQMIESQKADIAELKAQVQALLQAVKK